MGLSIWGVNDCDGKTKRCTIQRKSIRVKENKVLGSLFFEDWVGDDSKCTGSKWHCNPCLGGRWSHVWRPWGPSLWVIWLTLLPFLPLSQLWASASPPGSHLVCFQPWLRNHLALLLGTQKQISHIHDPFSCYSVFFTMRSDLWVSLPGHAGVKTWL